MTESGFTVDVDQNQYLPEGARTVNAVVSVTSAADTSGLPSAAAGTDAAEIIIVDCSGSMDYPHAKMAEARAATAAAVDVVRDGVWFAVIAGTHTAWSVFPAGGSMAIADASSRAAAKKAVTGLRADGGTAIGHWLSLACRMFESYPAQLRHAILLTDGQNQHEKPDELTAAIARCEGAFSCDCRGVGTDWDVSELRRISTALLGTVDIVPDPAGLAADFTAMMENAMGKQVADVVLRVWTPPAPPAQPAPPVPTAPPTTSSPYVPAVWTAVVAADRAYFESMQAASGPDEAAVTFPAYCAERRFRLAGNQMRIGRRSVSRGLEPEIDLTGPPADPGISRLHAALIATPDGNWAVLDPGSANGTLVNGREIVIGDKVSLHDGDRINLGAWTAITVHRG